MSQRDASRSQSSRCAKCQTLKSNCPFAFYGFQEGFLEVGNLADVTGNPGLALKRAQAGDVGQWIVLREREGYHGWKERQEPGQGGP